jgi:hypothetical protein
MRKGNAVEHLVVAAIVGATSISMALVAVVWAFTLGEGGRSVLPADFFLGRPDDCL